MEENRVFSAVADGLQAHEKIVAQIKDAVFEGTLKPGERLPAERELADIFRTSRVTVRSAILTLRNNGIVTVRKGTGGGTFIAQDLGGGEITDRLRDLVKWNRIGIRDVMEVRGILEPQIASLAAVDPSPRQVRDIWNSIKELEASFSAKSTFRSRDENFHKALAAAANNPLLSVFQASIFDLLFSSISSIRWTEDDKRNIAHHHRNIAQYVENKDPRNARKAMIKHLEDMRSILSRYTEGEVWI